MIHFFSSLLLKLPARCLVFTLVLQVNSLAVADSAHREPLKVFLLIGQSNMQGHAHVRTFEHIGMDPVTAPLLRAMQTEAGTPTVCDDVWISLLSNGGEKHGRLTAGFGADENKIGPEFSFGIFMRQSLSARILIIKTAWGGKSLNTDFRSSSAGPYLFNQSQIQNFERQGKDVDAIKAEKVKATGHYYRLMIGHVKKVLSKIDQVVPDYDSTDGYELAGAVWFQGWNDMVDRGTYPNRGEDGGYDAYSEVMAHFIRDIRRDLTAPNLPFVIGVLGVGGPVSKYRPEQKRYEAIHSNFRKAMAAPAALPEFRSNVRAVFTENYWDMELTDLRAREAVIKREANQRQKQDQLTRDATNRLLDELRRAAFTDREREILSKGVSNAEYHYWGSAKIMAQIGKGFADSLAAILR